ncbi:diacylglycerol/lipid kinase family protein [Rhodococcus marinonascens]|uniref:diacylglycerol/lipid kinase family protein n=1 Tax=Rhodococcus marinonascens TaxID=38311 RepID=UPI0009353D50|nr:diacylglycerol kinase family protein [Rhodococcus marinonascens]
MRALLIVNPNATSTTPAGRDLLAHALSSRVQLTVTHTTHRGHAAELAQQAHVDGMGLIIVHGGDGTVNEVVNGLLGAPTPQSMRAVTVGPIPLIAVVPGGSANVFARSLGIAPDPVDATNQLIDLLAHRQRRRIGLAHCDGRWFTFNAGVGWDAQVCEAVDAHRKHGRPASPAQYVRAAVRIFFRSKNAEPTLTVRVPGHEPVEGVHYAFVSNSSPWTYLNTREVRTNPDITYDTGLGVFAMKSTALVTTLRVVRQLLTPGTRPNSGKLVRVDDVPSVRITASEPIGLQMDGDYIGLRKSVEFISVPDALDVVAPPQP